MKLTTTNVQASGPHDKMSRRRTHLDGEFREVDPERPLEDEDRLVRIRVVLPHELPRRSSVLRGRDRAREILGEIRVGGRGVTIARGGRVARK